MLISRRATVALLCTIMVLGAYVCAMAVEMNLAGIKLGSQAVTVLKKYGNPTRITVATLQVTATPLGIPPQSGMMPGTVPGTVPGAPSTGGLGPMAAAFGSAPSGSNPYMPSGYGNTADGGLPPLSGMGAPGTQGMAYPGQGMGMPGMPGNAPEGQPVLVEEEATYTYDLKDGTTVEFIISGSGRVIQITVGGDEPFALSKTSKGIKLGKSYKDVIFKYGYPESQTQVGRFLRASYADKHRCVFTFLNNKLVGITIALKPEGEE